MVEVDILVDIEGNDFKLYECPVCLEYFQKPIRQCVKGHSFCEKCLQQIQNKICPECRSEVTDTRNYKLEELLEKASLPCIYKSAGCPFVLNIKDMSDHVIECKNRILKCEGKKYCNWKCDWMGHDIKKHFDENHKDSKMEYQGDFEKEFDDKKDFYDIYLISAHYQQFWFKQKIDIKRQKVFWAIQFLGPKKNANYYYYEFEIYNKNDPIKKYKITEYCTSDIEWIEDIFHKEKCVAISFNMLKNYLNNETNKYSFRFRLQKIPNPDKQKSKPNVDTKSKASVLPQKVATPQLYNTTLPIQSLVLPTQNLMLQNSVLPLQNQVRFDLNGPVWLPQQIVKPNTVNDNVNKSKSKTHRGKNYKK